MRLSLLESLHDDGNVISAIPAVIAAAVHQESLSLANPQL
jgi:hypothetical protein